VLLAFVGFLSFGIGYGVLVGPIAGIANGVLGLIGGVLCIAFGALSVMKHRCLRTTLRAQKRIPGKLVAFLDYVCSIVVMRQVGGRYLFEYNTLREYFVDRYIAQHRDDIVVPSAITSELRPVVKIEMAKSDDTKDICRMFCDHFGYVYTSLLGTSPEQTEHLVERLMKICDGRSWIGYRTFWVARDQQDGHILGVMQCVPINLVCRPRILRSALKTLLLLPVTLRNPNYFSILLRLPSILTALPRPRSSSEIIVNYIAVKPDAQRQKVGTHLLQFVDNFARDKSRTVISANVRTENITALHFFLDHGFTLCYEQRSRSDTLFARGGRYHLYKKSGEYY
jgi:ribosomal protein S18 acetylase RimI-like enzyme